MSNTVTVNGVEKEIQIVLQNIVFTDGSASTAQLSGDEFLEVPEATDLNPMERDGSWEKKFLFNYAKIAEGVEDALIGMPGYGQAPGYDAKHGENWELPGGWVLNRGSSSGMMYLSGYDKNGIVIFMEMPWIPSADPNNTYTKGNPEIVRYAST